MEKLIVLSEDGVSEEFPLVEQQTSIGREEHNTICLSDKSVSRHHATVRRVFRGFTIQDEGSTNGTRVNGRVINKQFLKHRDLIEIGKYHLRFLEEAASPLYDDDADKTVVIRPVHQSELAPPPAPGRPMPSSSTPAVQAAPAPVQPQPTPQAAPKPAPKPTPVPTPQPESPVEERHSEVEGHLARICYLAGDQKGQEVEVDRAFFSVGKPGGDLVLINKRHNGYFLLKVGGDVPPTINGTPIKAGGVELHHGDRVELGELLLEFRV